MNDPRLTVFICPQCGSVDAGEGVACRKCVMLEDIAKKNEQKHGPTRHYQDRDGGTSEQS